MQDHLGNTPRVLVTRGKHLAVCLVMSVLVLTYVSNGSAADTVASNKHPLSFGTGQTIIDLQKVVWEPLKGEGILARRADCAAPGRSRRRRGGTLSPPPRQLYISQPQPYQ